MAIDGSSGTCRGHGSVMRRPRSRRDGAVERPSASGRTYPQLAQIVRMLCAVAGRRCQRLAAAVAVSHSRFGGVRPGPRPQILRPHQVKTPQAGPRSEDYLHPPCRLRASRISSAATTSDAHINQFCAPPPICPEAITAVQNGSSGTFQFDVHCLPFSLLVCLFPGVQPRKWPMRGTIT